MRAAELNAAPGPGHDYKPRELSNEVLMGRPEMAASRGAADKHYNAGPEFWDMVEKLKREKFPMSRVRSLVEYGPTREFSRTQWEAAKYWLKRMEEMEAPTAPVTTAKVLYQELRREGLSHTEAQTVVRSYASDDEELDPEELPGRKRVPGKLDKWERELQRQDPGYNPERIQWESWKTPLTPEEELSADEQEWRSYLNGPDDMPFDQYQHHYRQAPRASRILYEELRREGLDHRQAGDVVLIAAKLPPEGAYDKMLDAIKESGGAKNPEAVAAKKYKEKYGMTPAEAKKRRKEKKKKS